MPFSGPFDLSLGGYTVTPGQGPGSPPPVDLGAYSVFPGGGRVSAPGLGFGPSTAAYNPGSGFFEGAVSGSPESVTGAISGPGTPSLGSAGPSVAGSPNAPSDGPAGPAFSSGFLGQNIGILGGNLPSGFASQGVVGNAVNQGLSNIGITNPTAQSIANFGLSSLANAAVPGLGLAMTAGNAVTAGLANSQMANTLNEGLINPTVNLEMPDPQATATPDTGMVNIGPLGTAGPAFAGVGPPGTMGQSISNANSPTGLVSLYSGTATNNINLSGRASGSDVEGVDPTTGLVDTDPSGNVGGGAAPGGPGGVSGGPPGGAGPDASNPSGQEASDSSSAAGGGGGGGGGTVICTLLRDRGLLAESTWQANGRFRRRMTREEHAGYLAWAGPLVRFAQSSPVAFAVLWCVFRPVVRAYMREIETPGSSRSGRLILRGGLAVSRWLGRRVAREAAA